MPIQYSIVEYPLSSGGQRHVARVHPVDSVTHERVVDMVVARGSTVGRADVKAVLEDFYDVCRQQVTQGNSVNIANLAVMLPRIRGSFDDLTDQFDASRHEIQISVRATRKLREAVQAEAGTSKIGFKNTGPAVTSFKDAGSGTTDTNLTPGNIGTIIGARLKFNPQADDEGIFLKHLDSKQTWHIQQVSHNRPRQLIFRIPDDLATGQYQLQVAKRPRNSNVLRTGYLNPDLTV